MTVDARHQMIVLLPRLRRFARSLAGSPDDADDLVQETCERALRGIDQWTPGTRLDSWMFRIMRNHWVDRMRQSRVRSTEPIEAEESIEGEDGRRTVEARLTYVAVRAKVAALPEEQRSVLILVCAEGLSYREAADVLEVPVGTVMSRLARARRAVMRDEDQAARAAEG